MTETLAKPQEFKDAEQFGEVQVPTSVRTRRVEEGPRIVIANGAPRIPITIPTGLNKTMTVEVVDKSQNFHPDLDMLRARWHDVVRRPSDRTMVYDAEGKLIARFESWAMAAAVFKKADILKAVETKLARLAEKRKKDEQQARERLEAQNRK